MSLLNGSGILTWLARNSTRFIMFTSKQTQCLHFYPRVRESVVWYFGWKKSCTTWDVSNLVDNEINYLSTGAGFQPSTVGVLATSSGRDFFSIRFGLRYMFFSTAIPATWRVWEDGVCWTSARVCPDIPCSDWQFGPRHNKKINELKYYSWIYPIKWDFSNE